MALLASTSTSTASLFERIGGAPAILATVDEMYDRILNDPTLTPFFQDTDMASQKMHQRQFLTIAFGGVKADIDIAKYITEKHAKSFSLGLNETHFDSVVGHVVDSLASLNVPTELIEEVGGIVGPLRPLFEAKEETLGNI
jgi:hemoglobin